LQHRDAWTATPVLNGTAAIAHFHRTAQLPYEFFRTPTHNLSLGQDVAESRSPAMVVFSPDESLPRIQILRRCAYKQTPDGDEIPMRYTCTPAQRGNTRFARLAAVQ